MASMSYNVDNVEAEAVKTLPHTNARTRPKFLGLDVLRGCAALSVVLFHANVVLNVPWLMPSGPMAVDLFFTMSGFVIAYAYDVKIPTLGLAGFIRVRAIRFYPLYLLGLGLGVLRAVILLRLGTPEQSYSGLATAIAAALIFFPSPISAGIAPLNGPAWSLILEMWINAAYALFFRYLTTRILGLVIIASAVALSMYASVGEISGGPHWSDLPHGIARVCYSFPLGVLLYRHRHRMPDARRFGVASIAATAVCLMIPPCPYYNLLFILVLSPCIIILGSQTAFNPRLSAYMGMSSYCIYAIHSPLLMLASGMGNRLGLSEKAAVLGAIVGALAMTPVLDRLYDRPLREALSSLGRTRVLFRLKPRPLD